MRATIRNVLVATPALVSAIPAARWYSPGKVLDQPAKPFAVLRWIAPVASNAVNTRLYQLRVEVHDERGSYSRIEDILGNPDTGGGVYGALAGLANHVGADARITQMDYLGHSGDQEDVTYNTNLMFSSWRVIGVNL